MHEVSVPFECNMTMYSFPVSKTHGLADILDSLNPYIYIAQTIQWYNVETEVHNELTAIGHGGYYVTVSVYAVLYFLEDQLVLRKRSLLIFFLRERHS